MTRLHVLVAATGSVAIVNLPQYLTVLKQDLGADVRLVLTPTAERFIGTEVAALFCDDVYTEARKWERGRGHVALGKWADVVVVLPATAHLLASAAAGAADTLVASLLLVTTAPVLIFPNMHAVMWVQPAVQRNVRTLNDDGRIVVAPRIADSLEVSDGTTAPSPVLPGLKDFVGTVRHHIGGARPQ